MNSYQRRRHRERANYDQPLISPRERQLIAGWILMLDVDLDLAQRMLRLPPARLPVPPLAVPPVYAQDWNGSLIEVLPAIETPADDDPPPAPRPATAPLRGAYARRARTTT